MHACGGRAEDVADEDAELGAPGERGGRSSAREAAPRAAPDRSMQASSGRVAPAPREGEVCYSPSAIAQVTGIGNLLDFPPADAIDENGCLASDYSGWLDAPGCNYDPRPAVVRGERCCHLLDRAIPTCARPFVVAGTARTAPVRAGAAWLGEPASGPAPELP